MSIAQFRNAAITACIVTGALLAADSPFVGSWKMNPEKSKVGESGIGQTAVQVEAIPNGLKSTISGVNAKGDPTNFSYEATFDGKPGAVTGYPNVDTVSLHQVNPHSIKATGTKGDKLVYTDHRTVSKDGKTMTIERDAVTPEGKKYHATLVFDRQ